MAYGSASSHLFVIYLAERRNRFGRISGPLLRSESNRNCGSPLGCSSWSKTVERLPQCRRRPSFYPHLPAPAADGSGPRRLTIDQIAQYAGHRDLATTIRYIHLSGRELAARFHRANTTVQAIVSVCSPRFWRSVEQH
ncbi:hypothetical protein ACWGII_29840 [Streptomyces sp. NPDC054855]